MSMTEPITVAGPIRRRCFQCGKTRKVKAKKQHKSVLFCSGCMARTIHGNTRMSTREANWLLNRRSFTNTDWSLEKKRRRAVGYTARCINTCHIWDKEG